MIDDRSAQGPEWARSWVASLHGRFACDYEIDGPIVSDALIRLDGDETNDDNIYKI